MHISVTLIDGERLDFDIEESTCIIGRSAKCQVVIPHDGVSRQHCQLEVTDLGFFVTDLGSTNGVMISGEKIKPNVKTEFKSYLPLSFGPVQSLLIKLKEDPLDSHLIDSSMMKGISTESHGNLTRTTMLKPAKGATQVKTAVTPLPKSNMVKTKKTSVNPKMLLATVFAVLIIVAAFYIHQNMENSPDEAPATKSSGPVEYY